MFSSEKISVFAETVTIFTLGLTLLLGSPAYAEVTASTRIIASTHPSISTAIRTDMNTSTAMVDGLAAYQPSAYKQQESHQAVLATALGRGAERVYVFTPAKPQLDRQKPVPVVFLHHGWQGMNPQNFGALIDHLARTGHVVIYPVYQESEKTSPQIVTQQAVQADKDALAYLAKQGLTPDLNRILYVGFSMGAAISLNIATAPNFFGLPAPKGMVLMAPGDAHHVATGTQAKSIIGDVTKLPPSLAVAVMTGAADTSIGVPTARQIAAQMCHLPESQRALMLLPSDTSGERSIKSGHGSPGAPDNRYNMQLSDMNFPRLIEGLPEFEASVSLNQLDFFGFWRVITTLNNTLASAQPVVVGSGSGRELSLGMWPNGVSFKPIQIEHPCGAND